MLCPPTSCGRVAAGFALPAGWRRRRCRSPTKPCAYVACRPSDTTEWEFSHLHRPGTANSEPYDTVPPIPGYATIPASSAAAPAQPPAVTDPPAAALGDVDQAAVRRLLEVTAQRGGPGPDPRMPNAAPALQPSVRRRTAEAAAAPATRPSLSIVSAETSSPGGDAA